ncbi:BBP7 family outer membrane beta-barrel protein [bacterium]|nr:BBP7 family outer membrane beta-barrel protein [bacterium]
MQTRFHLGLIAVLGAAGPLAAQPPVPRAPAPLDGGAAVAEYCPAVLPAEASGDAPGRAWASAEWLFWVTSGHPLPPLIVAGSSNAPGAILFGGRRGNNDFRNGLRVTAGAWLDDTQAWGVEGDFFFLGQSRDQFATAGNGSQVITRPFFNTATGAPDAEFVSFPGTAAGRAAVDATSNFIGGGVNLLCNLHRSSCGRADAFVGYRYQNLRDDLGIQEDVATLPGAAAAPGSRFQVADRFRTGNDFHGGRVGVSGERAFGPWFVGGRAAAALGVSHQVVTIDGSTIITPPGGTPATFPGGLLALPTNTGRFERDRFAVVPEVQFRVGCQVSEGLRVSAGYDFMYWSSVARATRSTCG